MSSRSTPGDPGDFATPDEAMTGMDSSTTGSDGNGAPQPTSGSPAMQEPPMTSSNEPPQIFPVMDVPDAHPERSVTRLISAYDPNNDTFVYSLRKAPTTASIDPNTGDFEWTPGWPDLGSHQVVVRVTDSHGAWAETSFIITVQNQRPEMGTLIDRNGHPQQSVSFGVFAYDPDGDPLTYKLVKGPAGAQVDPVTGHFEWTPTWGQLGAHVVTISATDPGGLSDSESCVITIGNQPPIMDPIMDQPAAVGEPVSVQPLAMDPDGDPLTYSKVKGPADATVDPGTGNFDWTPSSGSEGAHIITIRCEDPGKAADQQSFVITVS
jgi:hypothetical protein